ncbi:hypothetical protein [Phenylobacterium sp.]|uniref:hypothetical protein n=1 Tax=Phenylobacterium sp. TaxID=1871053 RepID=UPI0025DC7028|nr:hypothetical protein [Phenylobacterium sp.]
MALTDGKGADVCFDPMGDDLRREQRIRISTPASETVQKSKCICWAIASACWDRRRASLSRFSAGEGTTFVTGAASSQGEVGGVDAPV